MIEGAEKQLSVKLEISALKKHIFFMKGVGGYFAATRSNFLESYECKIWSNKIICIFFYTDAIEKGTNAVGISIMPPATALKEYFFPSRGVGGIWLLNDFIFLKYYTFFYHNY